jgi:hypothetical protein
MNCVKFMVVEVVVVAMMVVEVEGLGTSPGVCGCTPRGEEEKTMGEMAVSTLDPCLGAASEEGVGVAVVVAMGETPASAVAAAAAAAEWNAPGESGEVIAPVEVVELGTGLVAVEAW